MPPRGQSTRGGLGARVLSAVLEFSFDRQAYRQFQRDTADIQKQIDAVAGNVEKLNEAMAAEREGSFGYAWLGVQLAEAKGQAVLLREELDKKLKKSLADAQAQMQQAAQRSAELAQSLAGGGQQLGGIGMGLLGVKWEREFVPLQALESMTNLNRMMTDYLRQAGLDAMGAAGLDRVALARRRG